MKNLFLLLLLVSGTAAMAKNSGQTGKTNAATAAAHAKETVKISKINALSARPALLKDTHMNTASFNGPRLRLGILLVEFVNNSHVKIMERFLDKED